MLWAWALEPYPVSPEELGYMREAQSGTKKPESRRPGNPKYILFSVLPQWIIWISTIRETTKNTHKVMEIKQRTSE